MKTGTLSLELANTKCGPLNQSRWLTTGLAFMMLWMRHHGVKGETLAKFETIIKFIISVYFNLYFQIKVKHHISHGPEHIVSALKLLKEQTTEVQDIIIKPVIQRGAYHAHTENILASLICSCDSEDRSFAVDKIIKLRDGKDFGDESIRCHTTPTILLDATSPKELVNWDSKIHEPIFICKFSLRELKNLRNRPLEIPKISLHTQSCE